MKACCEDMGKLLARLAVGMMVFHGIAKLQDGVGGIAGMLTAKGLPGFIAYGVYIGEFVAPLFVIAGIFSRPAAAIVAFNMVVAIGMAHTADIFKLVEHGGWAIELQMFYILGSIVVMCLGSGRLSVSRGKGRWD